MALDEEFCSCDDWKRLKKNHLDLFRWNPPYGWILNWIELTEEPGYTQAHRYGIAISYCPMCGKKLKPFGE